MSYRLPAALALSLIGCSATATEPNNPQTSAQLTQARQHLQKGEIDEAFVILDAVLAENGRLRPARVLAAEASLAMAKGGRRSNTEQLLRDAARNYSIALEIDAEDGPSWLNLAHTRFQLSEFAPAKDAALKAAELLAKATPRDEAAVGRAMIIAGDAAMRDFVPLRQAELDAEDKTIQEETLAAAQQAVTYYSQARKGQPGQAYHKVSQVYAWLSMGGKQIAELEAGMDAAPDEHQLHSRYRQVMAERGELNQAAAYYRQQLRDRGLRAGMLYSLGICEHQLADQARGQGDRTAARRDYGRAYETFGRCRTARPEWRDSCAHWQAVAQISLARMAQEDGNVTAGKAHLKKAFAATPKVLDNNEGGRPEVVDTFGAFYAGTLNHLVDALQATRDIPSFRAGLDLMEEFIALHPRAFSWLYNNAGLTARDLGVMIEAQGKREGGAKAEAAAAEAMKIYERAYELYSIAAEMEPTDARIVNDTGLMLIFHLHREYDKAIDYFDQALEHGLAAWAELDAETSERERNLLGEAIGDAYQNKARTLRTLGKPFAEYRPLLVEAVKYFPFQQRDAARWLRNGGKSEAQLQAQDSKKKAAFQPVEAACKQHAAKQDYDAALLELDKVAKEMKGYAPFHFLRGYYSLLYARKAIQRRGTAGQIQGLFGDACNNLRKAIEADDEPVEPRLRLAEALFESGKAEEADAAAAKLLSHIASRGGAKPEMMHQAQAIRAKAASQVYMTKRGAGEKAPGQLSAARNAFRALEKAGQLSLADARSWAGTEVWAGNHAEAAAIYKRGLEAGWPARDTLAQLQKTAQTYRFSGQAAAVLDGRSDADSLWYKGMCHFYSGFEAPQNEKLETCLEAMDKGIAAFEASAKANRAYANSCAQWIGTCLGMKGFFAYDGARFAEAEKYFLAAARHNPAAVTANISGERSVLTGIKYLVFIYFSPDQQNDLPKAVDFLQRATEIIKTDVELFNNLGLFARDHANRLGRRDPAAAKKFNEISYQAYKKCVEMEPNNVRQLNDLAVVRLYNVRREFEEARQDLIKAVELGLQQLENNPPQEELPLRNLNEAVGDSYENLGKYYLEVARDLDKAKTNYEKSLEYYPFRRRVGSRQLRRIEQMRKDGK